MTGRCNWLEFFIASEVVNLDSSKTVDSKDNLQVHVNPDQARYPITSMSVDFIHHKNLLHMLLIMFRFIFLKLPNQSGNLMTFFIFSCPENVQVKVKMTMSTSKVRFGYVMRYVVTSNQLFLIFMYF